MKNRKNLYVYTVMIALSAIVAMILLVAPRTREPKQLVIYDVHADSPRIVKDDGSIEYADYVRIRNLSDQPYDLTGLYLSDSPKNHDKLPLDGVVIEGGDSVMIRLDPSWNFALKRDGDENVYLSDSKGNTIFQYKPEMKPDEPVLSMPGGFYDDEFDLTITANENYDIFYTLDGSDPTEDSISYTGPIHVYDRSTEPNTVVSVANIIRDYLEEESEGLPVEQPVETPVDKAFIVRAAAIDEYGNRSDTVTGHYFFCKGKYKNIISVVADRDDLFGDAGIISVGKEYDDWYLGDREGDEPTTNYNKKGKDWEVPADIEYYRGDSKVLAQKCGLKVQGRTTRDRRVKNFQLVSRARYSGSDVFEYDFFENEPYRSDRINLDDSFVESMYYDLAADEEIMKPRTTDRTALFINGEFWNDIYIRQKLDELYFLDHVNVAEDNIVLLSESFPEIGGKDDESFDKLREYYVTLDDYAEGNDLTDPENYAQILTMMDIASYIDYLAINTWCGCNDWAEFNNDMCWRVIATSDEKYHDGRFRWILHDGDDVLHEDIRITDENFIAESPLFRNLMRNHDFRKQLAERIEELGRTIYSDENMKEVLDSGKWDESEAQAFARFLENRRGTMEELIRNELLKQGSIYDSIP